MAVQIPEASVQSNISGAAFTQQATPGDFGAGVGQAAEGLGQAGVAAAGDLLARLTAHQELDNETQATAANTQFIGVMNKATFDPKDGYYAKAGKDAVDAYQPTVDAIAAQREAIGDTLANPKARLMFDQASLAQLRRTEGAIGEHAQTARKQWMVGESNAAIDTAIDTSTNYFNNDKRFNDSVNIIKGEALKMGEIGGWSPAQVMQLQSQKISQAWASRIERMATENPVAAQDLYRANIDQIDGQTHTAIEKMLKSAATPVITHNVVQNIMAGRSTPNAGLVDAVSQTESDNVAGVTSSKGAAGIMQLMPDTAADVAKSLGVPYDPDKLLNDADYNKALGTEYLRQMGARYGGDQTLQLAAYNAGPGRVDSWIAQYGDPRTGVISDADFLAKIPFAETRDYVGKVSAIAPPTPGTVPTSADVRANLSGWMDQARNVGAALFPNDPAAQDQLMSHLITQTSQIQHGAQFQEKAARDTLLSSALGFTKSAAGDYAQAAIASRPTSLTQLLADPANKQAWAQSDPVQQQSIMGIIERNAKGEDNPLNDGAWQKYYGLLGMKARDPIQFAGVNLADPGVTGVLPHELTRQLMNEQATLAGGQAKSLLKGESMARAESIAKPPLLAAGVVVNAKAGTEAAQTYDAFVGKLDSGVQQFIDQNKRTPSDSELRAITNGLLTQGVIPGGRWFGFGDKSTRYFQADPGQFQATVPDADAAEITKAFTAKNGHAPTPADINFYYMAGRLGK